MNKILLVVDMQNDFITGPLGSEEAVKIVPKVKEKIQKYLDKGSSVMFTLDTHDEGYLKTREGKYLPVEHCIKGTTGRGLHSDLAAFNNGENKVELITKDDFAVDWYYEIYENLSNNINIMGEIEIVGLCTDICVVSNALILRQICKNARITVDASCCAGTTPEKHKAALEVMKSCQIEVVNE